MSLLSEDTERTYNTVLKTGTHTHTHRGYQVSFPGNMGRSVMLNTYLHLAQNLRMSGSVPPPPTVFMAFTETTLRFKFFNIFSLYVFTNTLGTQDYSFYLDVVSDRFHEHSLETNHHL